MSDVTSLGVTRSHQLFQDNIWKLHGLPEGVISDQGTQLVLNFMCGLSEIPGIKVTAFMAYSCGQAKATYFIAGEPLVEIF